MADVNWTPEAIAPGGVTPTFNGSLSVSDTYLFPNDGKTWLHIKKTGAGDCVVTVVTPQTVGGLAVADLTNTVVATTGEEIMGPFAPGLYNRTDGKVAVTFDDIAGLSVAVLRLP